MQKRFNAKLATIRKRATAQKTLEKKIDEKEQSLRAKKGKLKTTDKELEEANSEADNLLERMNLAYARLISSRAAVIKEEPGEDEDEELEEGMAERVGFSEASEIQPAAKNIKKTKKAVQDDVEKQIWSQVVPIVRQELKASAGRNQAEDEDQRDVEKIAKAAQEAIAKTQRHYKAVLKEEADKIKEQDAEGQAMETDHKEEESKAEEDVEVKQPDAAGKQETGKDEEAKTDNAEASSGTRRAAKRDAEANSGASLRSRSFAAKTISRNFAGGEPSKEASKAQALVTPRIVAKNVQRFDLTPPQWAANLAEARTRSASAGRRWRSTTPRRGNLLRQFPKPAGFARGEVFDCDAPEEVEATKAS